jgi:dolichyl-phosphate-mannose-protein mannosyltransferase
MVSAILLSSLIFRILLSPIQGNVLDLSTFASWYQYVAENGIHSLYETWCDYPPFNAYIFWVFGSLAKYLSLFGTSSLIYVLKLPANIFDTATSALVYLFLRKRTDFTKSLYATSLYLFNPATIFNTSIWGQFDAIYTFFLVLSLIFVIDSKPRLSAVVYAIALLTKPQSIALAPVIIYLIYKKYGWGKFITSIFAIASTILIVIMPFTWDNPVTFLFNIYSTGYGGYQYTTINAFNIWAFFGFWKPDSQSFGFLNYFVIGWALFACSAMFSISVLHKRFKTLGDISILFSSFLLLFSFFMLLTRIHERYLFPAISVLVMMFPFSKKMRPFLYILSLTYLMNQAYVMYFLNLNQFIPDGDPLSLILSLINCIMFIYVLRLAWGEPVSNGDEFKIRLK